MAGGDKAKVKGGKFPRPQGGKEPATPAPVPAFPVRLNPACLGALFASFSALVFIQCWNYFPVFPHMFRMSGNFWVRDAGNLVPSFPGFLVTWGGNVLAILLFSVFELVSWMAGRRALSWVTGRESRGLWGFLFSLGLGNGILGTLTLGMGLAGLVNRWVFVPLLAIPLAVGTRRFVAWRRVRADSGNPLALPRIPTLELVE